MKYFFDTEFYDDGNTIIPISLGIISETGETEYVEWEFDIDSFEETSNLRWLKSNVVPHLTGEQSTKEEIRVRLLDYFERTRNGGIAEFWLYYGAWDWLLFCRAVSTTGMLMNGPAYMSMYFNEIMQLGQVSVAMIKSELHRDPRFNYCHNALDDAIFQKELYYRLTGES